MDPLHTGIYTGWSSEVASHRHAFFNMGCALIPASALPMLGSHDRVAWMLGSDIEFTVASTLWHFCRTSPTVPWANFMWSPGSPVLWLVMHGRLYMSFFIFRLDVVVSPSFALCLYWQETVDYLFFLCSYSSEVWRRTFERLVPTRFSRTWSDISSLLFCSIGGALQCHTTFRWLLSACIYYLWMERNKSRIGECWLPSVSLSSIFWLNLFLCMVYPIGILGW